MAAITTQLSEEFYFKNLHEHQPPPEDLGTIPSIEIAELRVSFTINWGRKEDPPKMEIYSTRDNEYVSLKFVIDGDIRSLALDTFSGKLPELEAVVHRLTDAWRKDDEREAAMRVIRFETERRALGRR